jgi:very-short-patch-repair endonuclease
MNPDETPRDRARRLRAESTAEEQKLWRHLRAKRFGAFKFRRQHRILLCRFLLHEALPDYRSRRQPAC